MACIASLLGLWALLLVPETNRVPIERLQAAFARHWLWKRFFTGGGDEESGGDASTGSGAAEDVPIAARDQQGGGTAVLGEAGRPSRRTKS
jgi:hypothetical protein